MNINVPLYLQKKGSVDCGHICLQMIFAYYGVTKSYQQIKEAVVTHKVGTYTPQLGQYLLNEGFKTNIYTMNPSLFVLSDREKSQQDLLKTVNKMKLITLKSKDRRTVQYFCDYLQQGGVLTPSIPDESTIRKEIEKGRPLLALLTSNFLSGSKRDFNFHFNVITGIDKTHIYCNDPLSDKRGGKKMYKIADYLYAIHASAYGDIDNACIMSVGK